MRPFGTDDDSVMQRLANELDIQSATARLKRVGFTYTNPNIHQQTHRFHRINGDGIETLSIKVENNRFLITWMYDEKKAEHVDIICSWDQWVDFVRLLVMRSNLVQWTRMKEIPDQ